jgi:hypothetical protein
VTDEEHRDDLVAKMRAEVAAVIALAAATNIRTALLICDMVVLTSATLLPWRTARPRPRCQHPATTSPLMEPDTAEHETSAANHVL